jgi:cell division protein FtsZ
VEEVEMYIKQEETVFQPENAIEIQPEPSFETEQKIEERKEQAALNFDWEIQSSTPEVKKEEVIRHVLEDESTQKVDLTAQRVRTIQSPEEQQRLATERMSKIEQYTQRLRKPDGLASLEAEPAFKRRNIQLDNTKSSEQSTVSRFGLSEDQNGTTLRGNNSFLHDNVD